MRPIYLAYNWFWLSKILVDLSIGDHLLLFRQPASTESKYLRYIDDCNCVKFRRIWNSYFMRQLIPLKYLTPMLIKCFLYQKRGCKNPLLLKTNFVCCWIGAEAAMLLSRIKGYFKVKGNRRNFLLNGGGPKPTSHS